MAAVGLIGCADDGSDTKATTDAVSGSDTNGGADDTDGTDGSDGSDGVIYYNGEASAALGASGNQSRCSTCHSADGSLGGSGKSFKDIAFRSNYKGGLAPTLLEASNACVTGWMGGEALTADDAEYVALKGYLESISDPTVTAPHPVMPEVLADQAAYEAAYAGGDATAGADKYTTHCGTCHDGGLVVASTAAYAKAVLSNYPIGRIAQKVRTAGPPPSGTEDETDTTPGPMPFFELEDVSAEDLKDIIAFIKAG